MDEFAVAWVMREVLEEVEIAGDPGTSRTLRRSASWRAEPFSLSDFDFLKNFRLSKSLAIDLINTVQPHVPRTEIDIKTKVSISVYLSAPKKTNQPTHLYLVQNNKYLYNLITQVQDNLTRQPIFLLTCTELKKMVQRT